MAGFGLQSHRALRSGNSATDQPVSHWRATWTLGFGQLVSWGALYYAYVALAPSIATSLSVSRWVVGCAFSLALAVSGLLARGVGRKLDEVGARPVLLAGAIAAPLSLVALATVRSKSTLWAAFVVIGVAQAFSLYEPAFRAVVEWFPRAPERSRALLLVTSLGGLASTVFVPLTASLASEHGWRAALLALAAVLALTSIPSVLLLPRHRSESVHRSSRVTRPAWQARDRAGTRRLSLAFGTHAFASATVSVALLWHLVEAGEAMMRAAFLTGLAGAAQVPGRIAIGVVSARVRDEWRLPANFVAQAIALLLVAFGNGVAVIAGVLIFGASSGALTLERAAIVATWFGTERFGSASGYLAAVALAGRAAAPFVVELANLRWSYANVLALLALLLAIAAFVFVNADRARRSSASP